MTDRLRVLDVSAWTGRAYRCRNSAGDRKVCNVTQKHVCTVTVDLLRAFRDVKRVCAPSCSSSRNSVSHVSVLHVTVCEVINTHIHTHTHTHSSLFSHIKKHAAAVMRQTITTDTCRLIITCKLFRSELRCDALNRYSDEF